MLLNWSFVHFEGTVFNRIYGNFFITGTFLVYLFSYSWQKRRGLSTNIETLTYVFKNDVGPTRLR